MQNPHQDSLDVKSPEELAKTKLPVLNTQAIRKNLLIQYHGPDSYSLVETSGRKPRAFLLTTADLADIRDFHNAMLRSERRK